MSSFYDEPTPKVEGASMKDALLILAEHLDRTMNLINSIGMALAQLPNDTSRKSLVELVLVTEEAGERARWVVNDLRGEFSDRAESKGA